MKVSAEDLGWLYADLSEDEVVAGWHASGVSLVLVTRGADGASASTPSAEAGVAAPRVDVVDTVGAGDAFMAGVLAHLYERRLLSKQALQTLEAPDLVDLLHAACFIAADTCTRAGAEPPRRRRLSNPTHDEPREVVLGIADLVERARALAVPGHRRLLGITGARGVGTSVARSIVEQLGSDLAVLVPTDGFYLSNRTLIAWGRRDRKGAWDTFDAVGYVHLLRRLRNQEGDIVHAPDFDRDVDQSVGSALPVPQEVPLVVTEGNYLLSHWGAWAGVAPLLDESWYLQTDDIRSQEPTADQDDAAVVAQSRARADLVVTVALS